jgi:hypothetical protein
MEVITAPEQVTPSWLTGVLRKNKILTRGKVISVNNKLTKKLSLSVVFRLQISYSTDATPGAPAQLFLKLSSDSKEVEFYNLVASQMDDPPFVRCYDAAYSSESGHYHLLLDDLSDTHFQTEPPFLPSPVECEKGVECLAKLHAFWWDDPRLGKEIGKLFDASELDAFLNDVENNVGRFIDSVGPRLSSKQIAIYERILRAKHRIWGHLTNPKGLTVTHGDAHWWNVLFPRNPDQHRAYLFDWQLWHVDLGPRDLAFMVGLGGYSQRNSALEQRLTHRYYEALIANGLEEYSWDDFWLDYRWSAMRNLNIVVIQWSQGKSEDVWGDSLEKATQAYEELGCPKLLE